MVRDQPRALAALGPEPIRTIRREDLKAKLDRGEPIKLVMALNRWAFDAKHIPGSLHFDDPAELFATLGEDDEIVVYCSNVDCLSSVALYRALLERGYRNVRRYAGGLIDWEEAGLPLEGMLTAPPDKVAGSGEGKPNGGPEVEPGAPEVGAGGTKRSEGAPPG